MKNTTPHFWLASAVARVTPAVISPCRFSAGPAWRAVEGGETVVRRDLQSDSALGAFFHAGMRRYGLARAIALPIRTQTGTRVLLIHSLSAGNCRDEERQVLKR